jgi:WD40 repeat protein
MDGRLEREHDSPAGVETGESTIRIWDWRAGKVNSTLVGPPGRMTALAWHPDGRRLLAFCGYSSSIELRIWDTATGRKVAGWHHRAAWEASAAFSPDGSRLLWGMRPVRVTDLASGQVVTSIGDLTSATWSPSGDRIASTTIGAGTIKIWDVASGEELYSIAGDVEGGPWLSWSPKGERLAAQSLGEMIRVWDMARRKIINRGAPDDTSCRPWVAFSPDGKRLLVGAQSELPRIYDVDSGEVLLSGQHGLSFLYRANWFFVYRADWSPDGKQFAAPAHLDQLGGCVLICDAKTGKIALPPIRCGGEPESLAWSPEGEILAVGLVRWGSTGMRSSRGQVILLSASTGKQLASADLGGDRHAVAWSPDGKRLAATGGGNELFVCDSTVHALALAATGHACCVDWSPDGKKLATGSEDGTIAIYDAASGRRVS